ncbi:MAG TPA: purine-nucleoside phosphorylase [Pilimelia sp.]|nr:purine-nucleoside phosphorylase [Pilimelia sp.]
MSLHIAASPGQVAPRVLLPGDPLRARWIAETFLDAAVGYSAVRGMLGFTGTYQGVPVSVQGTGMGMPSAAIYCQELAAEYGARTLIRVGTCGALVDAVGLREVVAASGASTDSQMNRLRFGGHLDYAPVADFALLSAAVAAADRRGLPLRVGPVLSSDAFYPAHPQPYATLAEHGVLAVEMEAAALYTVAARFGARALALLTVSDHLPSGARCSADEREHAFGQMVQIALDAAVAAG